MTLENIAAVAPDLIATLDHAWMTVDVNPSFCETLGWPADRVRGRAFTDVVFPEDRVTVRTRLSQLSQEGSAVNVRCRCVRADGGLVWVDWRASRYEGATYIIGRELPEHDDDLATTVATAVRRQLAEEERRRLHLEEQRDERTQQLLDSEHRATVEKTRASTFKTWVGALLALLSAGAGAAVWTIDRVETSALRAKAAEDRRVKIDEALRIFSDRINTNEAKIRGLGEAVVETQIQVSDGTDYLADKIDAAHPRTAAKVQAPATVVRAKAKVDELKKDRRVEELFNNLQPAPDEPPP